MKTEVFVVLFALSINLAYSNSVNWVRNAPESAIEAEATADTKDELFQKDEQVLAEDTPNFGVEVWQARQCFAGSCNAHCRKLGHARGVCIGNLCQCRLRSSPFTNLKEEDMQEIEPTGRLGCNILSCLNLCTRLGFRYFRCNLNGSCTCWN